MADQFDEKSIKLINRDFQSLKRDLMKFAQAHHSGVFQDFNESSPGMAILELTAYVGDVLSFYQDQQFLELKQESARQVENVVAFAKQLGYRPSGKRAASCNQTFFIEIPATVQNGVHVPDDRYTPLLKKGAQVSGPGAIVFETVDNIDFNKNTVQDPRFVTGSRFDDITGLPTHFAVRKNVDIVAGKTATDTFVVGDFERFKTIELSRQDVIEVLSVTDSDGNDWTEVEHLAQESVFSDIVNQDSDSLVVPFVLKIKTVPRRFITDRNPLSETTSLIFGSGNGTSFDDELVPNLADLSLPLPGRSTFSSFSIDPRNFLKTRSLGLSPYNTTLTVTYRVGGGVETNLQAGSISAVDTVDFEFTSTGLDPSIVATVEGSIETINTKKSEGGSLSETISEIKANSSAFFAAQDRVVTREDYIARIMSLPAKFGKPEKVHVARDSGNSLAINVHVLAQDDLGYFTQVTESLNKNIKTYISKYRMMTDGINLLQTSILNLKLEFGVVVSPKFNRTEVLARCLAAMRSYFSNSNMQTNQPIVFSDISKELQNVLGVISVYKIEFKNIKGTVGGFDYSVDSFDVGNMTKNGILYCPENSIFEIKFPNKNIIGESR